MRIIPLTGFNNSLPFFGALFTGAIYYGSIAHYKKARWMSKMTRETKKALMISGVALLCVMGFVAAALYQRDAAMVVMAIGIVAAYAGVFAYVFQNARRELSESRSAGHIA